jgi:chemotaxis protein histidine kinase CheA
LAIVDEIILFHGGTVRVESVEGKGTAVTVELPKRLSPAEEKVQDRRYAVLVRAITNLEKAAKRDLYEVTRSLGGSVRFHSFEREAKLIRDFSDWLNSGEIIDPVEVDIRRDSIVAILKLRLESISPEI